MKKTIIIFVGIVLVLGALYVLGSGFTKAGSAFIQDYAVSDDGTSMTITVGISGSVGYIRKVSVRQQEGGKLHLDCISAFGGINGSIGAKSEFVIPLDENTNTIGLYRNGNTYEVVLERDASGEWNRVK
ncbi:MAG TPA: hypothetical protein PLY06_03030 [Anaerolineaceae bacterium]|jgi:hypothetical protein|nr:hypothetical protein [Anaerolineaceae bacterium]